ncbi:hypothetical protein KP509_21G036300 [Ceratopteris richardii]|nr:hypothetical protein KP509_21G036300 [Ceratopteris richardii]
MLYSTTRLGLYEALKFSSCNSTLDQNGRTPALRKLEAAFMAGAVGTAAVNGAVCLHREGRLSILDKLGFLLSRGTSQIGKVKVTAFPTSAGVASIMVKQRTMLMSGLQLAANDVSKEKFEETFRSSVVTCIVAGGAAGAVTAAVSNPIDNMIHSIQKRGKVCFLNSVRDVIYDEGAAVLFRGLFPTVICQVTFSAVLFGGWEWIRCSLRKHSIWS